ncbi:hypothetical protein QJS66_16655 [Kocuria rhizophila]|nr:hypothetical protein QJS66_16655 [Kocuria rhizophila]
MTIRHAPPRTPVHDLETTLTTTAPAQGLLMSRRRAQGRGAGTTIERYADSSIYAQAAAFTAAHPHLGGTRSSRRWSSGPSLASASRSACSATAWPAHRLPDPAAQGDPAMTRSAWARPPRDRPVTHVRADRHRHPSCHPAAHPAGSPPAASGAGGPHVRGARPAEQVRPLAPTRRLACRSACSWPPCSCFDHHPDPRSRDLGLRAPFLSIVLIFVGWIIRRSVDEAPGAPGDAAQRAEESSYRASLLRKNPREAPRRADLRGTTPRLPGDRASRSYGTKARACPAPDAIASIVGGVDGSSSPCSAGGCRTGSVQAHVPDRLRHHDPVGHPRRGGCSTRHPCRCSRWPLHPHHGPGPVLRSAVRECTQRCSRPRPLLGRLDRLRPRLDHRRRLRPHDRGSRRWAARARPGPSGLHRPACPWCSFIAVRFVKKSDQGKDLHVAEVHEE